MKKLWIGLTLLAVVLFAFAGMACAEETILVNDQKTVEITISGDVAVYEFTPEIDGLYRFYSTPVNEGEWISSSGYLLDEDMQVITQDKISGNNGEFKIVRQLNAGETYYLCAGFAYNGTGSFKVGLEETGIYAKAKNERVYAELNQPGTAEVEATSLSGGLAYQWYDGETLIAGANEKTYAFPALTGAKDYRCVVTDAAGNTAEVTVETRISTGLTVTGSGDVKAAYGSDVTLSVAATATYGADQISYVWIENYRDENGNWHNDEMDATGATLVLHDVRQSRNYYCLVTDINGDTTDCDFYVRIPGRITVYPVGASEKYVESGGSVTMTVSAVSENNDSISYRWYKEVSSEDYYEEIFLSDVNGPTCTIENVYDGCSYFCEAVNSVGNSARAYFWIGVRNNRFTAEYDGNRDFAISPGENATLKVKTSNNIGTVTYQWFRYSNVFGRFVPIKNAVSGNFTVSGNNQGGRYACDARDGGTDAVRRLEFNVTVENHFSAERGTDSDTIWLDVGETAELQVNAHTDSGKLFYRWYKSEYFAHQDYFEEKELIEGEQTNKLTITADKKCYYECVVSDEYGNSSTIYFNVLIDTGFSLTGAETRFTVSPGESVRFSATGSCADGSSITYRWSHWDQDFGYRTVKESTENFLLIEHAGADNYGEYELRAYDAYGNYETFWYFIEIDNHTTITAAGETELTVLPGDNVTLGVTATSDTNVFSYLWYQQVQEEDGSIYYIPMASERQSTLALNNVRNSGYYYCQVMDEFEGGDSIYFHVLIENGFTVAPLDDQNSFTVDPETMVTLAVNADCTDGILRYQWYREYQERIENGGYYWNREIIEGANNASYTTGKMTGRENYYCQVSDQYGNFEEVRFYIHLDNGLTAWAKNDFSSAFIEPGETVTMEVAASCKVGNLSYQWYRRFRQDRDFQMIEGATEATYITGEINERTDYYCRVSDEYGSSTNVWFNIYVDSGLTASAMGGDEIWVTEGETATLTVTASNKDGSDNLSYQWMGLNNFTNTLETEPVYEGRGYTCIVTDEYENTYQVQFYVGVDQTADISSIPITAGQPATANIAESGTEAYFVFMPEETGYYRFYSEAPGYGTSGYIKNPGLEVLVDDHGRGPDNNFLIEYELKAGRKYILSTICHNSDFTGTFPVRIEIMEGLWSAYPNISNIRTDYNTSATMRVLTKQRNAELSYVWKKMPSGEIIEPDGGATLTIDSVTQYGEYVCTVSDQYGKQISVDFRVYVNNPDLVISYEGTSSPFAVIGEEITLQINVSGNGSGVVRYQWYKNWVNDDNLLEGEEGATLTVTHGNQNGEDYYCRITDQYGNRSEYGFWIQTVNGFNAWTYYSTPFINAGESVSLDVNAECNDGSIHYEWYENEISPETLLEDEQGSSLFLDSVQHRSTYICRVSDDHGNIADLRFQVTVWKENQLTASAKNNQNSYTVEPGETVTMAVQASCDDGDMSYQWYRCFRQDNGDGEYYWGTEIIEGADGTTYTTDEINDRVDYCCWVYDEYGNSREVRFYIYLDSGLTASAEGNTEIWVAEGETVTLTVTASNMNGNGNISYWWDGYDNTTNTLITDTIDGERYYTCYVTDEYENTVNVQFHVGVDRTADLSITPITAGEPATVVITETGAYHYFEFIPDETAYYRFYSTVDDWDTYGIIYNPSMETLVDNDNGGTGSNFLIKYKLNAGQKYILAARYWDSSITESFPVCIEILEGLWNAYAAETNTIRTDYNGSATLQVVTEQRNAVLTYTWRKMPSGETIETADGDTLTIDSVTQYEEYECTVSDQYGNQNTVGFQVYVNNPDLAIDYEGEPNRNIVVGETTTLQINVSGDGSDAVQYQWYGDGIGKIEGETEATLTVTHRNCYQEWYYCEVTDQYGNKYSYWFWLYTINGFYAWTDYSEWPANAGDSITLNINAQCNDNSLHYQWYKDAISSETMLEGEQSSSLFLENVQTRNTYYCHVSDDSGNAVDLSILVKVLKENQLTAIAENNQDNFTVEPGETVTMKVQASCSEGDLSYEWHSYMQHEDENGSYSWTDDIINGADAASYTLDAINRNAKYYCTVSDQYENSIPVWFTVYVNNEFSAHALNDQNSFAVEPGAAQTMTVEAGCKNGELSYRWFRHVHYENDGNNHWQLEAIDGADEALFTTGNCNEYAEYLCRVSDQYENYARVWFYINIDSGLTVEAAGGETEIYVLPEQPAELQVSAHCNYGELTYQWYEYDMDNYTWEAIADATGAAYTTGPISRYMQYYCRVDDQYGNSQQCSFYVHPDNGLVVDRVGSAQQYAELEAEITLEVDAACDVGGIAYQWYESAYDAENRCWASEAIIEGETESSITVTINGSKHFHCYVHDEYNNSDDVNFEVYLDNKLTSRALGDTTVTVPYGQQAVLEATASCNVGGISYQWCDDQWFDIEGATNSSYTTPSITANDRYICKVRDEYGNSTYTEFYIYYDSGLTAEPAGAYVFNINQAPITLAVNANSLIPDASISYEWWCGDYYGQLGITSDNTFVLAEPMAGKYCCNVSDGYQTKTVWFYIGSDSDTPIAYYGNDSSYYVDPGKEITLKVIAWNAENDIQYQWFERTETGEDVVIDGATEANFTLIADHWKDVFCRISGTGIQEEMMFHIQIRNSYSIDYSNTGRIIVVPNGGNAQLSINVTTRLDENPTYQWYRNDEAISGETSSTLIVTTGGDYHAIATDRFGNTYGGDTFWCVEEEPATVSAGQTVYGKETGRTIYQFVPDNTGYYQIESGGNCSIYLPDSRWELASFYNSTTTERLEAGKIYYAVLYEAQDSFKYTLVQEEQTEYTFTVQPEQDLWLPPLYINNNSISVNYSRSDNRSVVSTNGSWLYIRNAGTANVTVVYENGMRRIYHITVANGNTLTLPSMLQEIEADAFNGDTSVRFIELGSNVLTVKSGAFANMGSICVTVENPDTVFESGAFTNSNVVVICKEYGYVPSFCNGSGIPYLCTN